MTDQCRVLSSCIPIWCLCNCACSNRGQIPAPGIKATFRFVPRHLYLLFPHSITSATMSRQLICPPRLLFHLSSSPFPPLSGSLGSILGESWPSLLSAESFGLKAAVSCPPFPSPGLPVMLWAPALSPWSTKLMWMCAAIHSQHVVPNHLLPTSVKAEHCANLPPQLGQKDSMWYKAAGAVRG